MTRDKILPDADPRVFRAFFALVTRGRVRDVRGLEWTALNLRAAVKRYGPPGQLEQQLDDVQRAANVARDLPMDEKDRKRILASIMELGEYIRRLLEDIKEVGNALEQLGYRFNRKTGEISSRRPGKGRNLEREMVWAIYAENFRDEYLGATLNRRRAIRREIGKRLSSYIEGRELIPDAKVTALIYDTIREGEARKRPLK